MKLDAKLLPILAFIAFLSKTIAVSPSIADSVILLGLIAYIFCDELRLKDKTLAKVHDEIKLIREQNEKQATEIKNLQGAVSSVKLATGLRPVIERNNGR